MSQENRVLRIDIVSDVVCPWCIIGYKQLQQAIADTGIATELEWHPFELNPQMAEEGEDLREHLAAKYGTTPEESVQARAKLSDLGRELGFTFNFTDESRMHNTFKAHQLLHWAGEQERKHDLEMALFAAHFSHGRNIGDVEVLADIAAETGLDRDEAAAVLADGRYAKPVREAEQFWVSKGIRGVPAVIFDLKHLATGAQGVANFTAMLRQLTEGEAA